MKRKHANRPGFSFIRAVVSIAVIGGGVAGAYTLVKMRKPPQKQELPVIAPLVKVVRVKPADIPMIIHGYGTVRPRVEVDIVPEVSGKVVSVHPQFKIGGFIGAGEPLMQIDRRDYELALRQANAAVADAQVRLDMEVAEADVARSEWEQLHPDTQPTSPLVLRAPQIAQARATLESAQAQLATAQLRLDRTTLSLPFDVRILSEKVDVGQYVVAGQSVGSAYGMESAEVEVPLEDVDLAWFDIFQGEKASGGASARTPAQVIARFAAAEHVREGYVTRTVGQVDRMSRQVSVVVEVPKPFEPFADAGDRPPLLPGTFVQVRIQGRTLENALAIPRDAVRAGNELWVVRDDRLHIEKPTVIRADRDFAYIQSPDGQGLTVIVSSLDTPVEGMALRTRANGEEAPRTPNPGDLDRAN